MRSIDVNDTIKTLGLEWNPTMDVFQFYVSQVKDVHTKRQVLSAISKLFDLLGLIGPILTKTKLIMQETWRTSCDWDDLLPIPIQENWTQFQQDLKSLENLSISRRIIACEKPTRISLQGFCDASEAAYGACLYILAEDEQGRLTSRLLISKSRVAPVKSISIPRLELCSAVSLTRLMKIAQRALRIQIDDVQAWSDSMVTIYWIRGDVSRWKTFVANRVSEITQTLPVEKWKHIRGEDNPADLISRDASPTQLTKSELWWSGP